MKIRKSVILPNLITLGNGICGFAALVKVLKVNVVETEGGVLAFDNPTLFATAAWLVLWGMVFDVFDGRVARFSGKTSELGAQLDSLCDMLTFGLVPAAIIVQMNMIYSRFWANLVWLFALGYFLGAVLRLARFNAENAPDDSAHLCFKGLPTPAAAGCIASLVIFYYYLDKFQTKELLFLSQYKEAFQAAVWWIPFVLPVLALFLGFTMVSSRLKYEHMASRIFNRAQSFDFFVYLVFGCIVIATVLVSVPEVFLPLFFIGYLLYTPLRLAVMGLLKRQVATSGEVLVEEPSGNGSGLQEATKPRSMPGDDWEVK